MASTSRLGTRRRLEGLSLQTPGGTNVVAHGDTRRQVLGLQVVFADGGVGTRPIGPEKQSLGPDLMHLLVGSEGTLGVITAARLRLVDAAASDRQARLIAVERLVDGLSLLGRGVTALEFFDPRSLEAAIADSGTRPTIARRGSCSMSWSSPLTIRTSRYDAVAVVDRRLWQIVRPSPRPSTASECLASSTLAYREASGRFRHRPRSTRSGRRPLPVRPPGGRQLPRQHRGRSGPAAHGRSGSRGRGGTGRSSLPASTGSASTRPNGWRQTTDPALLAQSRRVKEALDPDNILDPRVFWGGS